MINDITTDNLGNLAKLFADDTSLSYSGKNFDLMQIETNNDLEILDQWEKTRLVDFNPNKTKALRNACTKSGSLRFSQFSGCWLILSVYIIMSFDFPFVRLFGVR